MKNYKVYGNEPTSLTLSEKASAVYECTDPLEIRENEDGTYKIAGNLDRICASAEAVNHYLEEVYDDTMRFVHQGALDEKITDVCADYIGGNNYAYIGRLQNGLFFKATDCNCYEIRLLDTDPRTVENWEEVTFSDEWQEAHTVADFYDTESVFDWFIKMYLIAFSSENEEKDAYIKELLDYKYEIQHERKF